MLLLHKNTILYNFHYTNLFLIILYKFQYTPFIDIDH